MTDAKIILACLVGILLVVPAVAATGAGIVALVLS